MNSHLSAHEVNTASEASCPVCDAGTSKFHDRIDGYDYFQCIACSSLYIDPGTLDMIDAGNSTRVYDANYWNEELRSARERSDGASLVRAGEAILYARRPVRRFLDVGTGPGYLLDELAKQFPRRSNVFHGVELFPPNEHSTHPNYVVGDVADLQRTFDAGVCIEVIEHLTPHMLGHLVDGLARISEPDSLWLFNTSLAERTVTEDPGYLDPLRRGHIVSYSLIGLRRIFEKQGFNVQAIPGKNYAFIAEYQPSNAIDDFEMRIMKPLAENEALLGEAGLMLQATLESARSSYFQAQCFARSKWALDTVAELERARQMYAELQQEHERTAQWAKTLDSEEGESQRLYAALQQEYLLVLHSRSWRLTRPLRKVMAWLRSASAIIGRRIAPVDRRETREKVGRARRG